MNKEFDLLDQGDQQVILVKTHGNSPTPSIRLLEPTNFPVGHFYSAQPNRSVSGINPAAAGDRLYTRDMSNVIEIVRKSGKKKSNKYISHTVL